MSLNKILSEAVTEQFGGDALPKTLTPETKLRRRELAAALTQQGFPMAPSTLASMGSRGTGPDYELWGRIPIYTWGPTLDWAHKRLRRVRFSSAGMP